ncbi:Glyoxalase-like domain-containing protein [Shimia gijangensis]|uniref:Glyoxalase-like domain-containing protein n=1 Tax=Shimia gijangensis TaxID=1470563 RepID=A0A1M6NZX4_9RHOB|nr:VOC family protein [Shimia gijangensis]SHK01182.1 Glyoxalase-like domain-containing protein [Shimia gijangensis]
MYLDHLAVAGDTLEAAVAHVEASLGVKMGAVGRHTHFGTHNRLIGLEDGLYLEAIAIDPDAAPLPYARWFDLDEFSGAARLNNWICHVDDLGTALRDLPKGAGQPVALTRGDLRWLMAVPDNGKLPCDGGFPALIEWQVPEPPGKNLPSSGLRMTLLEVAHPEAAWLRETLPIKDARLAFVEGPFALRAHFETPNGTRVLE